MNQWVKLDVRSLPLFKLRNSSIAVLLALARQMNSDQLAATTYGRLSHDTGYTRRACIIAVNHLQDLGILHRHGMITPRDPLTIQFDRCIAIGSTDPEPWDPTQGGSSEHDRR